MNDDTRSILLVDDDEGFLRVYQQVLEVNDYSVATAVNGEMALKAMDKNAFPVVIADIIMPKVNGMDLLNKIKSIAPETQVILLTGEGTVQGAVEAMKRGAFTYLLKPINVDELLVNVQRAMKFAVMQQENTRLKNQLAVMGKDIQLLGISPAIKTIKRKIAMIASSSSTVLISGESGTGKEIVANLVHMHSDRSDKPLIKVNCAALAESVLESELFGHEKGAFTGATCTKMGRFELANGGTLFLDEISEINGNTQKKLLRVLQEKEFERVGGTKTIKTDFRLITATNRNLPDEIKKGNFREDLYYRINVIPIYLPPLRERREDIPILLTYFFQHYCNKLGKKLNGFSSAAQDALVNYPWPGNVRELKNIVERLVVLARGNSVEIEDLPETIRGMEKPYKGVHSFHEAKTLFECEFIKEALERNDWNITATAKEIGIARKNLHLKIKEMGLKKQAK